MASGDLEDPSPSYTRSRAEGLSLGQARWVDYLRKYRAKKLTASEAVISHFDQQRALQRPLTGEPALDSDIHLGFVGDLMWIRSGWNDFLDPRLQDHLASYDLLIGNLETPIAESRRVPHVLPDVRSFNSPPELLTSFAHPHTSRNLFSALSLANNHCLDQGVEGAYETLDFLRSQRIAASGLWSPGTARRWVLLEAKGLRIGLYAATWGLNDMRRLRSPGIEVSYLPGIAPLGQRPIDTTEIERSLDEMDAERIDFKIVSLHWGFEYETYPDPAIMALGRRIVEAGADLILGSHPHVVQPNEVCVVDGRKALIVYSLGNFLTAMYTPACELGVIESIRLRRNPEDSRVTWHRPEARYVYNVRSHPQLRRRRLMLIEDLLRDLKTDNSRRLPAVERTYEFHRRHVGW